MSFAPMANGGLSGLLGGGDWGAALQQAAPMLMTMGQNMMAPPHQRDPHAMQRGLAMMMAQAKERKEAERRAALEKSIFGAPGGAPGGAEGSPGGLLAQMGVTPEMGGLLRALGPEKAAGLLAQRALGAGGQPRRYNVGGALVDADGNVIYESDGNTRDKVGLNPIFGTDEDGNPVVLQTTDSGAVVRSEMPPGVMLSRDPMRVDAGTHFVFLDPVTRRPVAEIPKDNYTPAADAARGAVEGKAAGTRATDSAKSLQQAEEMLRVIDGVANDPKLGNALGWAGYEAIPDVPGVNTGPRARIAQLQGQVFLQAFDSLKGAGQITEVEGQQAREAIARLKTTQTEEEFRSALSDLRTIVERARERAARLGTGQKPFDAERAIQDLSDDDLRGLIGQ